MHALVLVKNEVRAPKIARPSENWRSAYRKFHRGAIPQRKWTIWKKPEKSHFKFFVQIRTDSYRFVQIRTDSYIRRTDNRLFSTFSTLRKKPSKIKKLSGKAVTADPKTSTRPTNLRNPV